MREGVLTRALVFKNNRRAKVFCKGTIIEIEDVTEFFGLGARIGHAPEYKRTRLNRKKDFELIGPLQRLARAGRADQLNDLRQDQTEADVSL